MTVAILLIFLFILALASAFLFLGIRGYRIGDHPVCRRCGFDLFGQPPGTIICGECGTSLKEPRSVLIGHHQRRPRYIAAGLIIEVPMLLLGGIFIWGLAKNINWLQYAPTSWLISRASSSDVQKRASALAELDARLKGRHLSTQHWDSIAEAGLDYQGDLSKPWIRHGGICWKMRMTVESYRPLNGSDTSCNPSQSRQHSGYNRLFMQMKSCLGG